MKLKTTGDIIRLLRLTVELTVVAYKITNSISYSKTLENLTHSFPTHPFSTPPENIRKPYCFLMFSGGRERVHWEQTGKKESI